MVRAVDDHQSRVGQNPTGAALTTLVSEAVPLNRKKRMVEEKILSTTSGPTTLMIQHNANSSFSMSEAREAPESAGLSAQLSLV